MQQKTDQQFNILDPQKLEEVKRALDEIIVFNNFELALNISAGLKQLVDNMTDFSANYNNLYKEYYKIIAKMKWIALHLLDNDEVIWLFQNYFTEIFGIPFFDIEGRLRLKMLTILVHDERDKLKKNLQFALANNQQELTLSPLDGGVGPVAPTVTNWIIDYTRSLGTGVINKTKQTEYLTNSINARKLISEEREKIRILFNIYEKLKLSSLGAPGMEENISVEDGDIKGTLTGAGFEPMHNENQILEEIDWANNILLKADIPEFIKEIIRKNEKIKKLEINKTSVKKGTQTQVGKDVIVASVSEERKDEILEKNYHSFLTGELMGEVAAEWEKIKAESRGGMKEIRTKFYHAVNNKDKNGAIGALMALADKGQIRRAFGEDERFRKFWGGYLEKQGAVEAPLSPPTPVGYGGQLPSARGAGDAHAVAGQFSDSRGAGDARERFANDPANAKDMALFIKYILEKRLEVAEKEAVMIGVVIGNLARKAGELEYQEMAYGEMETGEFRWNF